MFKPSSALNISPMMWPIEPWPPEPNGTGLPCPLIQAISSGMVLAGTAGRTTKALATEPI